MTKAIATETAAAIFLVFRSTFGVFSHHFGVIESKINRKIMAATGMAM
jgi:hypothetical protein